MGNQLRARSAASVELARVDRLAAGGVVHVANPLEPLSATIDINWRSLCSVV